MLRYWPTTEEITMYRLQGYTITITDESGTNGTRGLFECTLDHKKHREDGPAYMRFVGEKWHSGWYQHGSPHREDGPAIIRSDGTLEWWVNGSHHRDDGPATIRKDGMLGWYRNDSFHRDDGPATIWSDGEMCWCQDGRLHREDGPAVIRPNGALEWWLDGDNKYATREDWLAELEHRLANGRAK